MTQPYPPSRLVLCEIQKLYELLTLRNVCDIDTDASAYFSMIDPASAEMEEICLLTEALENAAAAYGLVLRSPIDDINDLDFWGLSA